MDIENDALAQFAVKDIASGMTVGLGTGRTASRAIHALAARVEAEGLDVRCVSTSSGTTELARSLSLKLVELADIDAIDLLFDGADEVDQNLVMLKGRGGAMTREKVVAHASERRLYLVQKSKLVERLGQTGPVPVEVLPFAARAVMDEFADYGIACELRTNDDGSPYQTDNGGHVIHAQVPDQLSGTVDSMHELSLALKHIPGVIEHGLFVDEADAVLAEGESDEDMELYLRQEEGEAEEAS